MSVMTWSPKAFTARVEMVKAISIRHKNFDASSLRVHTEYKGTYFELYFRNHHKHKKLECVVHKDGFYVTLKHDKSGYITGHDFVRFINRICNNIEGI